MHIVLVEPEIPGNTGNISRLCAAEHLTLHLVEPLGFSIDDKHLKRAGLDYWDLLEVHVHPDFSSVALMLKGHQFYYNTTKAVQASPRYPSGKMMCWYSARKPKGFRRICSWPTGRTVSGFP